MSYKTTQKDFEEFKTCCQRWIDFWGLYEVEFYFSNEGKSTNHTASYAGSRAGSSFTVDLSKNWNVPPEKNEINKTAFHEISEILLVDLRRMAEYNFANDEVEYETHRVVRRLENCVFKNLTSLKI